MTDLAKMDEAAKRAATELARNFNKWSARAFAEWWRKWVDHAGHKRLFKVVLKELDKKPGDGSL